MGAFALVVVNYRTAPLVSRCLDAAAADCPAEVVVVDNASGDGSAAALRTRHPDALVVERPHNDGFAAGVNVGFAATTAPVVVLLNPDTEPQPGALTALVGHLERTPRAGVAAPRLLDADGSAQPSAYRRDPGLTTIFIDLCLPVGWILQRIPRLDPYRLPPRRWRTGAAVAHAAGAALAVRREAYEAAGPLDEGYFLYLEETEWQRRVRSAGFSVELVPAARVVHLVRGGGAAALAPSPHFLASARRYLVTRGTPALAVDVMLACAIGLSRVAARAERLVIPGCRRTSGARAAAYDALWATIRPDLCRRSRSRRSPSDHEVRSARWVRADPEDQ